LTAIFQFLPTLAGKDAIGKHSLQIRRILREAGFRSEIFADNTHSEVAAEAHTFRSYRDFVRPGEDTLLLYHFSIGSPVTEFLKAQDLPLAIDYHNITDGRYFERWDPLAAATMYGGRRQLAGLLDRVDFALADSAFNEHELVSLGFERTRVAPILVDFDDYDDRADKALLDERSRRRQSGGADWLFVGRVAPNKCQHDLVAAFAVYRRVYDPEARLTIVGGRSAASYWDALHTLVRDLGLGDSVVFTDSVADPELYAYYLTADVFVCLSEHEGFNVPVLEAMHFGLPVVAFAAAAVPETVADAGVVLTDKDPVVVAAAVARLLADSALRDCLVAAGRRRVAAFSLATTSQRFLDALEQLLDAGTQRHG
jgi:glycosyltransferase involved in cell wall biosynthesis